MDDLEEEALGGHTSTRRALRHKKSKQVNAEDADIEDDSVVMHQQQLLDNNPDMINDDIFQQSQSQVFTNGN